MKIDVPLGSTINKTKKDTIKIKIPNTKCWILGEKDKDNLWDAYLINPETKYKAKLREKITTKAFGRDRRMPITNKYRP